MDNSSLRNTTDNATSDQIGPDASPVPFNWGVLVFCFAVGIFILLSNGFTLFFLYKLKDELKRSFLLIAGLSVSDIIFGVGSIGYACMRIREMFYKPNMYICASVFSVFETGAISSLFHTFCICFERLLAVRSKTAVKRRLGGNGRVIFIGTSTTMIGFYFSFWKIISPFDISACSLPDLYGAYYDLYLDVTVLSICLPLLLCTVVCYFVAVWLIKSRVPKFRPSVAKRKSGGMDVARNEPPTKQVIDKDTKTTPIKELGLDTAHKSDKNIEVIEIDTNIEKTSRIVVDKQRFTTSTKTDHKMKAMKTIGLVVLVLVLFTGSGVGLFVVDSFCRSCISVGLRSITAFLWAFNSALNPCIYYFTIDEFRYAVKRKFTSFNREREDSVEP